MDAEALKRLKEDLIRQIDAWDGSDRGFSDIVRNAIDLDKRVVVTLRSARKEDYRAIKGWGAGRDLPDACGEVVAIIRGYFQNV